MGEPARAIIFCPECYGAGRIRVHSYRCFAGRCVDGCDNETCERCGGRGEVTDEQGEAKSL